MQTARITGTLDRFAQVSELADRVRGLLWRTRLATVSALGAIIIYLFYNANPGTIAFGLICLGTVIALSVWTSGGKGLPLLPLMVIQNLFIYGVPIATDHEVLGMYPEEFLLSCGVELLVFSVALTATWSAGMRIFPLAKPVCFALPDFQHGGSVKLKRLGMILVVGGALYQVLEKLEVLGLFYALLPSGTPSLVLPLVVGLTVCGFFLMSLFVGAGELRPRETAVFWTLFCLTCMINSSGLLLSGVTTFAVSVFVGLFWSRGRVPWRFTLIMVLILAFLNLGKFTMRGRYWDFNGEPVATPGGIVGMVAVYGEWVGASFDALGSPFGDGQSPVPAGKDPSDGKNRQSLLQRLNNLQNLLFVINAVEERRIPPIEGASYSLIVPLLVPRIMWPDKPRSHAGQVLLNVHFGRQDLNSTYKTYVAWGLIPEAYGNFGAFAGSLLLGGLLGLVFAWLETYSARKLLLSLEGFVCFVIILGMANSFEMVASVLVTTLFQSIVPIIFVSMPFLRRMTVTRPAAV